MNIAVLGLGKVGGLIGYMLHSLGHTIVGVDKEVSTEFPFDVQTCDVTDAEKIKGFLSQFDIVFSALPYNFNMEISTIAHQCNIHYLDLTEDVETTNHIKKLSLTTDKLMIPQCGLAPGFIGIIGAELASSFDTVRDIHLRVGALPRNPNGMLKYAFNWSPEGVVNEYLMDCDIIQRGVKKTIPALKGLEKVIINGVELEAFHTSGGIGTLCETFENKVDELDYKTLRYSGHRDLMRFFFDELRLRKDRKLSGQILVNAYPPVGDDVVYIYAAVEGFNKDKLDRKEFVNTYYPINLFDNTFRAISWTTAASAVAIIELISENKIDRSGFVKQEQIAYNDFINTRHGSFFKKYSGSTTTLF